MEQASHPFIVAIGASGGEGLDDIKALLASLPHPIDAIVMVVLHRPSERVSALRDVLARRSRMPIVIAEDAETFEKGVCYIGEPDQHLAIGLQNDVALVAGANNKFRNRTIDTLFISLARHAGQRTIGVVLSGSLDDGSRGLAAIHAAGGLTMVLDPQDKPHGMQQNAIDYDGPISVIGTAERIGDIIGHLVAEPGLSLRHAKAKD